MRVTEAEYLALTSRGVSHNERKAISEEMQQAVNKANAAIPPPSEDQEQAALVNWLRMRNIRFNSTPNGGQRFKRTAARLKATGTVPGVPDLTIWPHIGSGLPILYIELKRQRGGVISSFQKEWLNYLSQLDEYNIKTAVCKGCMEAIRFIESQGY